MDKKTSKKMKSIRFNKIVNDELENVCNIIGISTTSFIEIAVIEKMAKLRAYSVENTEINKIYDYVKNIQKSGI